ncbi:MAG TPA: hypothetical protein PK167_02650 [Prolixibacteraceae bacterium]|nr:hypothetical protein [Prolixibacteraceae bacterium]
MKKTRRKSFRIFIFGALIGMVAMFLLDIVFHFNNSIETKVKREMDKAARKVEELFKQ